MNSTANTHTKKKNNNNNNNNNKQTNKQTNKWNKRNNLQILFFNFVTLPLTQTNELSNFVLENKLKQERKKETNKQTNRVKLKGCALHWA